MRGVFADDGTMKWLIESDKDGAFFRWADKDALVVTSTK